MAIASMQKVMIVAHRSQASELVKALQGAGIVQILDAECAMVSKEWPELMVEIKRHREQEELIDRLRKAIDFLKSYAPKDNTGLFAPLIEVDDTQYRKAISQPKPLSLLEETEQLMGRMEKIRLETENQQGLLERLSIWQPLRLPVEEFGKLKTSSVFMGLLPDQNIAEVRDKLVSMGAAYETVARAERMEACVIVALHETASEVQRLLRSMEFEPAVFEGLRGTIDDNVTRINKRLDELQADNDQLRRKAGELGKNRLSLQILYDYHQNFHGRMQAELSAPATDHAIFFEGWVKRKNFEKLKGLVSTFDACDVAAVEPGQDEEPPVEIDNNRVVRPFEMITRLYGMPLPTSIDPTVFLAPFFAIFFGLCMADAGYGLIMVALLAWVLKKARIGKGIFWMLMMCAITTTLAGVIMGSWFGDAITSLLPEGSLRNVMDAWRTKLMLFDPMADPMLFFGISLALGYFQIQCGLLIAFFANLAKKDYASAVFDQLVWVVHLNTLLCLGLVASDVLPFGFQKPCIVLALLTSAAILLFTVRSGGWGGRIGLGVYQLFSTVFFIGDILSYARLLALCLVGAGCAMAVNILVKLVSGIEPAFVGWLLGALIFVGGHLFNIGLSVLGAFVHSLRLQFVEFFPKFFAGGGKDFTPLQNKYSYIEIRE